MAKKLKIYNGRPQGNKYDRHHVYVAAYSMKQAAELVSQACFDGIKDGVSTHEIKNYYCEGAWGIHMDGIEAVEPCVYLRDERESKNKPFRVI